MSTIHRFHPVVAEAFGVPSALIYQTILWRSQRAAGGWVILTLDELCEEYFYLSRTSIWEALNLLRCGDRENASLIRRRPAGGGAYAYNADLKADPNNGAHSLYPAIIERLLRRRGVSLGEAITAGIIYANTQFWVLARWKDLADEAISKLDSSFNGGPDEINAFGFETTRNRAWWYMRVTDWQARHAYVSRRTVERAVALLVKEKLLRKEEGHHGKHKYSLPHAKMRFHMRKWLNSDNLHSQSDQSGRTASIPNTLRLFRTHSVYSEQKPASGPLFTGDFERTEDNTEGAALIQKSRPMEVKAQVPSARCAAKRSSFWIDELAGS